MGLPMWKDPEDETIVQDAAAKLDRAAAARRSTIRRETSVRPRDSQPTAQSIQRFLRERRQSRPSSAERRDSHISQLQDEIDMLRRLRNIRSNARLRTRMDELLERHQNSTGEIDGLNSRTDDPTAANPEESLSEPVTEPAAEPVAEPTIESADTVRQHLPRPTRESNLRFEVLHTSASRSSSPWRYQVLSRSSIPSPPYSSSSGERRDHSIPDGPILDGPLPDDLDLNNMPALTEGFAPARMAPDDSDQLETSHEDGDNQLDTPPPESWESSYPPLRRVSRMSPRPLPRSLDGLGDRRRSASPFSDHHEEETWATILTAMDTEGDFDTSTSFASNRSDSQPRTGRSSQNTSASFGEIGMGDETCELDLPPGITEEAVLELRARHRPRRDIDRMTGRRGLQEHHDRIAGRAQVNMFRAILERMHRREEVPDDWWATVGVSPEFGRS